MYEEKQLIFSLLGGHDMKKILAFSLIALMVGSIGIIKGMNTDDVIPVTSCTLRCQEISKENALRILANPPDNITVLDYFDNVLATIKGDVPTEILAAIKGKLMDQSCLANYGLWTPNYNVVCKQMRTLTPEVLKNIDNHLNAILQGEHSTKTTIAYSAHEVAQRIEKREKQEIHSAGDRKMLFDGAQKRARSALLLCQSSFEWMTIRDIYGHIIALEQKSGNEICTISDEKIKQRFAKDCGIDIAQVDIHKYLNQYGQPTKDKINQIREEICKDNNWSIEGNKASEHSFSNGNSNQDITTQHQKNNYRLTLKQVAFMSIPTVIIGGTVIALGSYIAYRMIKRYNKKKAH